MRKRGRRGSNNQKGVAEDDVGGCCSEFIETALGRLGPPFLAGAIVELDRQPRSFLKGLGARLDEG